MDDILRTEVGTGHQKSWTAPLTALTLPPKGDLVVKVPKVFPWSA